MANNQIKSTIPEKVLVQLFARFLHNVPEELTKEWSCNFVRIFFEIERAHWFYVDHYIDDNSIGGLDMFGLAREIPKNINWEEKYLEWRKYRGTTATSSAIIIDEEMKMVLLVQGFYGNRWSFPGGKINQNESFLDCAVREAMEETGLDIQKCISPTLYLDRYLGEAVRRAYIVEGLSNNLPLKPETKNEIEAITWFDIADLPNDCDNLSTDKQRSTRNTFYLVIPFVRQLKIYIDLRKLGVHRETALLRSEQMSTDCPVLDVYEPQSTNRKRAKVKSKLSNSEKNSYKPIMIECTESSAEGAYHSCSTSTELHNINTDLTKLVFLKVNNKENYSDTLSSAVWSSVKLNRKAFLESFVPNPLLM